MSRDRDEGDRPRKSWREIDRARDGSGPRPERSAPPGSAAEARERQAARQALKAADDLFAAGPGGAEGARLAQAVRDAHGSADLAGACAAYRDGVGFPSDPSLVSLFLDSGQRDLMAGALLALADAQGRERQALPGSLLSQLRLLAEDPDDEIAGASEELLEG